MQPTSEWPPSLPLTLSLSRFKLTLHCPLSPGLALSLSHTLCCFDSFGVAVAVGVEIIQLAISYLFASLLCCSPSPAVSLSLPLPLSSPHRSLGSSNSCHFRCVPDNRTAENSLFAIAAHLCRKSVGHVRRRTRGRAGRGRGVEQGAGVLGVVNVSMNEGQFETTALALTYSFARSFDLIV